MDEQRRRPFRSLSRSGYGDWARAHPIRAVICVLILIPLVPLLIAIAFWGIDELVSLL